MNDKDRWYVVPLGDGEMAAFKVIRLYTKTSDDGFFYQAVRINRDGKTVEWEYEPQRGEKILTYSELVALRLSGTAKVTMRNEL